MAGKLSELRVTAPAGAITGTELVEVTQGGATKVATVAEVLAAVGAPTLDGLSDVAVAGAAQGAILYRAASGWVHLAAGAAGQVLTSGGAGAAPYWATPAGAAPALTKRLWLRFEGGFTDSGSLASTITNSGATLDTATFAEGASSALIAASQNANVISFPENAALAVGGADFEIGLRVRFSSTTSASVIFTKSSGTGAYPYQILRNTSNAFEFRGFATDGTSFNLQSGSGSVSASTWYKVTGRRVGNLFSLLVDDVLVASTTFAKTLTSNGESGSVGNYGTGGYPVVGWLDDVYFSS